MFKVKRIGNYISTFITGVVVIVAAILLLSKIFGAGAYAVLSGSMEPTYHVGSLIVVGKTEAEDLKVNDPITFALSDQVVATHRIVEINEDNGQLAFVTKGDANEYKDANPVHPKNIIGKPLFSIPLLGYGISYIQQPPGMYIFICFIAALLLWNIISAGFKKEETPGNKE